MTKPATLAAAGSSKSRTGKDLGTTIPAAIDNQPETRWCRFTRAYCRCDTADLDQVTMAACGRHFMDEVSGHG